MNYIIHCDEGCSEFALHELEHIHKIAKKDLRQTQSYSSIITLSAKHTEKIVQALLRMHTAVQVGLVIAEGTEEEVIKQVEAFDEKQLYANGGSFALKGNEQLIEPIATALKAKDLTVNLKSPDNIIRINKEAGKKETVHWIISVDMDTSPLYKRDYKVFNNPASLRSTIAASALMAAKYTPGQKMIDPFCGGGTIPIEAALMDLGEGTRKEMIKDMTCMSWPLFEQEKETILTHNEVCESQARGFDHNITAVKSAQKNASIAQVQPQFTRYEAHYMAHTCKDVDCIVTQPPRFSERDYKGKLAKVLEEFAENVAEVLTKKGTLAIITNDPDQLCEAIQFDKPKVHDILMGKMHMYIVVWQKAYM